MIISEIISGVIAPITNLLGAVLTKKQDTIVEQTKVDGAVAQSWIVGVAKNLGNTLLIVAELSFILPLAIFFAKSTVWDNIFHKFLYGSYGYTPPLNGDVKEWAGWIMAYLFLKVSTKGYR